MNTSTQQRDSVRMPSSETIRRRMAAIQQTWSTVEKLSRMEEARSLQLRLLRSRGRASAA